MTPSPPASIGSPAAAPLPPLPDLSGGGGGKPAAGGNSPMAALMTGIAPIKQSVDSIVAACQQIVKSGVIPGSEQTCGQILALAASLLPQAAQQLMQPGPVPGVGAAPPPGGPGGGPPPSGPPAGGVGV